MLHCVHEVLECPWESRRVQSPFTLRKNSRTYCVYRSIFSVEEMFILTVIVICNGWLHFYWRRLLYSKSIERDNDQRVRQSSCLLCTHHQCYKRSFEPVFYCSGRNVESSDFIRVRVATEVKGGSGGSKWRVQVEGASGGCEQRVRVEGALWKWRVEN